MVAAGRYPGLVDLTLHFPAAPVLDQRGQLDGLSREWLADLALHGRSPSTLRAYRGDLLTVTAWARRAGFVHWSAIREPQIAAFIAAQHADNVGLRLIARRIGTVRGLFRFGIERGHELELPRIRTKYPSQLAAVADHEHVARILRSTRGQDFFALRDRACLEVLAGAGVTSSELCALDVDHVDLHEALLRVEAVHRTPRRVPLAVSILEALRAWLPARRTIQAARDHLALFCSAGGYRLSQDALSTLVTRRSLNCGIVPPLSPRSIRNAFGVRLFEAGASEAQVAALMGISMIRAEDLHRATNPHRRRASDALRRLIDRTPE